MTTTAPGWLVLLLVALAFGGSGCCGCCNIIADLQPPEPEGRDVEPDEKEPRVDLGDAEYPPGNDAEVVDHPWWLPKLEPSKYRLGYKLSKAGSRALLEGYRRWARSVGHKKIDKDRFQWRPPRGCVGGLQCVYATLDEQSVAGVEPIVALFRKRAEEADLEALQLASLVVTFVQEIHYRIPEGEPFGVKPPALVVRDGWGDCDSKTLLAHMILRSLGLSSVLISSEAHKHTMMGVALPVPGRTFTWNGRRYAFVELTAKRSPVGHIDPKLLRPNDWRVVKMSYKRPRRSKGGGAKAPSTSPNKLLTGASGVITGGRIRIN